MLFSEVYDDYLKYAIKRHKKQGFDCLTHAFKIKVLPYFKDYNIEDITEKDVLKWQDIILGFNFSNSYLNRIYSVFNSFMDYCVLYYNLPYNVVTKVGSFKKKIEIKNKDFYTLEEFNQFIGGFDNDIIYKTFFIFMFYVGTRPSEAMALKFSDLHGNYISINKNIQRKGNREIETPKNFSSIRTIEIDKYLLKNLHDLKDFYIKKYGKEEDYFIFGGVSPLSPSSIDRHKLKACERANIRPITQHQFRHSHATLLLQKGILINEVSRRLGHSNVSTTLNVYTHTNLEQEKKVIATLNSCKSSNCLTHAFKRFISISK